MPAILAIDPAWTEKNPSGVAVIETEGSGWVCRAVAPSYDSFYRLAEGIPVDWTEKQRGSLPYPAMLLKAARTFTRTGKITIVTIDMPIATVPITCRRKSDDLVAHHYGGAACSPHSPIPSRPGEISRNLSNGFSLLDYRIAAAETIPGTSNHLVEVYPHPALLALLNENYRIPYKVSRARRYWPGSSISERREKIIASFYTIITGLNRKISDIGIPIERALQQSTLSSLKSYEDGIDALICGWVGIKYLEKDIDAFGDDTCAIWIPKNVNITGLI